MNSAGARSDLNANLNGTFNGAVAPNTNACSPQRHATKVKMDHRHIYSYVRFRTWSA